MRHADDGTLHALLDGALWAESPERAEEVEVHLDGCADCRARLDRVATTRDRASSILAAAAPAAALPDFAEVLARRAAGAGAGGAGGAELAGGTAATAERARLRRTVGWSRGLAWAASLVVALGTGYLIGQEFAFGPATERDVGADRREAAATAPRGESAESDGEAVVAEPGSRPAESAPVATDPGGRAAPGDEEDVTAPAPPSPAEGNASAARPVVAGDRESPATVPAAKAVEGPPAEPAAPVTEIEETLSIQPVDARITTTAEARQRVAEPTASSSLMLRRAPDPRAGAGDPASLLSEDAGAWEAVDLERARGLLGGELLVLPDARVLSTHVAGRGSVLAVESVQALPGDVLVRVRQLRGLGEAPLEAGLPETAPDAAPGDVASVTVDAGAYRLVLRGPLPARVLRELALQARPGDGR